MPDLPNRSPSEQELRELAALADGSLRPERRPAVEARVAASPRLQAMLAEQRQAVSAIRARDETAPPSLRARIRTRAVAAGSPRQARPPPVAPFATGLSSTASGSAAVRSSSGSAGTTPACSPAPASAAKHC